MFRPIKPGKHAFSCFRVCLQINNKNTWNNLATIQSIKAILAHRISTNLLKINCFHLDISSLKVIGKFSIILTIIHCWFLFVWIHKTHQSVMKKLCLKILTKYSVYSFDIGSDKIFYYLLSLPSKYVGQATNSTGSHYQP